ncbi:response regulator transcription factor [Dehalococcoides mccartyi]|uniref:response regulator transcription factor n=1 Tax=Dehalococcoides mccartyi TaxID=61435 RepID=UPI0006BD0E8B|nr:response regulator transcription factor [Dehalococcoides mccartyi]BAS32457.1 LuxR family DNA-binding response regulator [Dehalococcoides mccartyi IBARAKI]
MLEKKIKVLICDDHDIVCQGLVNIVSDEPDMEIVGCATNLDSALTLIKKLNPDVVLADIRLGDESGFDLIKQSCQAGFEIPFIMITGFHNEFYLSKAIENGAAGLLSKESPGRVIVNSIRLTFDGHSVWPMELLKNTYDSLAISHYSSTTSIDTAMAIPNFTPQEKEIIKFLLKGNTNKAIAHELGLSDVTVKKSLKNIMNKLHVDNRMKLAMVISRLSLE